MTREDLIRAGVDYDGGVRRFAGKPQIYEKYLLKFFSDDPLAALQEQLEAGDHEAAFRSAHGLKGSSGALCLTELYEVICALTDLLRAGGGGERATSLCRRARELYRRTEKAVRE